MRERRPTGRWTFAAWVVALASVVSSGGQEHPDLETAWAAFWSAENPDAAARTIPALVDAGASYDDALARLGAGSLYGADVETGDHTRSRTGDDGVDYRYRIRIPESYTPERRYPVQVYLHGGVGRPRDRGGRCWRGGEKMIRPESIFVAPQSWDTARWWGTGQAASLAGILDRLTRTYNIDENRIHLMGTSDGGTGTFYHAFGDTTRWAGFLSFIGHPNVLANPRVGVDRYMYLSNLVNKPVYNYMVNGGRDPLYPVRIVEPYVRLFRRAGIRTVFRPKPDAGHDTSWWAEEAIPIGFFTDNTARDPLPQTLTWETDGAEGTTRAHWLVIDELGSVAGESAFPDHNRVTLDGESFMAFPHPEPSGRVAVEQDGNEVTVRTRGVRRYTLLLSPERFDLTEPLRVTTNDRLSFEGRMEADVETLLGWAARDNDRTMLFAAELPIDIGTHERGDGRQETGR